MRSWSLKELFPLKIEELIKQACMFDQIIKSNINHQLKSKKTKSKAKAKAKAKAKWIVEDPKSKTNNASQIQKIIIHTVKKNKALMVQILFFPLSLQIPSEIRTSDSLRKHLFK